MSSAEKPSLAEKLRVPLVVGVTGHIDIREPGRAEEKLETFWETIRKLAGDDTRIVFLTSIARGADHLATKVCRSLNVRYCVVLPFAEAEYRKDFTGPGELEDFDEDLRGAYKVITCDAAPRDYAVASDYVRTHCDVLLTMWDGYETCGPDGKPDRGGTYHQIRTAFGMDDLLRHHQEKKHLVVNIAVERSRKGAGYHESHGERRKCVFPEPYGLSVLSCDDGTKELGSVDFSEWTADFLKRNDVKDAGRSFTEDGVLRDFSDVLACLNFHNGRAEAAEPRTDYYLRDTMCGAPDGLRALEIVEDDFVRHEYFDRIAERHQVPHKRQFFRIAFFSVLVGILGQAWGDLTFHADEACHEWIMHAVIFLYLAGCAALFCYGRKITKDNHYSLYLQPRIVAEMLRLKIFWKLAGISGSFTDRICGESTDRWFLLLLCNWEVAESPLSPADREWIDRGEGIKVVKSCWIEDQLSYYKTYLLSDPKHFFRPQPEEKCRRKKFGSRAWFQAYFKKYERLEGYVTFCKRFFFLTGFILAILLCLVFACGRITGANHRDLFFLAWYREFIVGLCPFVFASLGWLLEKNKWDSVARQYRGAYELFLKTDKFVSASNSLESKRAIIRELMMFAHRENAEWNSIRSDAKPEPMI